MLIVPFEFIFKKAQEVDFILFKNKVIIDNAHYPLSNPQPVITSSTINGVYSEFKGNVYVINSCLIIFIGDRISLPYEDQTTTICLTAWN